VLAYCRAVLLNNFNSANKMTDEIASQSKQVHVWNFGWCAWSPLFQWSVSHCSIDSTWFPFDEQHCSLIYESWKYRADKMNLTTHVDGNDDAEHIMDSDFSPNGLWEITGKSLFSMCMP